MHGYISHPVWEPRKISNIPTNSNNPNKNFQTPVKENPNKDFNKMSNSSKASLKWVIPVKSLRSPQQQQSAAGKWVRNSWWIIDMKHISICFCKTTLPATVEGKKITLVFSNFKSETIFTIIGWYMNRLYTINHISSIVIQAQYCMYIW